jgi:GT2 family glycosyltransferase
VNASGGSLTVVVCTRNRADQLARTLDALAGQSDRDFDTLVIDQSDGVDSALQSRERSTDRFEVQRDQGRGLSRSRNLGWKRAGSDWIAYIDDDCVPDPDWAGELKQAIATHPEVSFVSGHVRPDAEFQGEVPLSTVGITTEKIVRGRRLRPDAVGVGAFFALKREWLDRLGGFDERLGTGTDFPGSEDMDFNYRFLETGGVALMTPRVRVVHEQWRTPQEELKVWRGYFRGWAGFTIKRLRGGDITGGLLMSLLGIRTVAGVVWGSIRMRSMFQLRRAWAMLVGLLSGTARAATRRW